jgi:hypothetical protein
VGENRFIKYSRTPLFGINWDSETPGYAENGSLKWDKSFTDGCFRLNIYLRTNKILINNSFIVFVNWGNNLSHKNM